jgi:O-acetylhomoserine/O-acetylserine sulfhydrylase-like pyridoxal-dependent enzyme
MAVSAGEECSLIQEATQTLLANRASFWFKNLDERFDAAPGKKRGLVSSRNDNSAANVLEVKTRQLEVAESEMGPVASRWGLRPRRSRRDG